MRHFYQDIQGMFRWPEIYERAVRMAPLKSTFVEIGCFKGKSTAFLAVEALNSGKNITIYAIDLWDLNRKIGCSVGEFAANLSPVRNLVYPIVGDSTKVCRLFAKGSVDFVFVDGNHSYPYAKADIRNWWRKLKVGGWMAGDDLIHGGVRKAVEEFFGPECDKSNPDGRWIRSQSPTIWSDRPSNGGMAWWTEPKSE
jgi:predicted O-methyltransferase YrrM